MQDTNPIHTTSADPFTVGESDFRYFNDHPHRCASGAILYCCRGQADVSVNLQRHRVEAHTLIMILPGTILTLSDISAGFRMKYCTFSAELFGEVGFRLAPSFFRFLRDNPFSRRTDDGARGIETWFEIAAYTYHDRENMFRRTIIKNRLQNIILEVYDKLQRRVGPMPEAETGRRAELLQRFIQLVRTECTAHREVAYYADRLCISTRYLSSIVRALAHKSAKEVIDEFVVLEIKLLLQSTDVPVQEIAFRMHFPDQSYLGHYFRKHTGLSPTEYRNRR